MKLRQRKEQRRTLSERRKQCQAASKVTNPADPRDAQSVMESLVSSGTTRGEPRFVPGNVSIASDPAAKVTGIGWAGCKSPCTSLRTARGLHDGRDLTTRQAVSGNSSS